MRQERNAHRLGQQDIISYLTGKVLVGIYRYLQAQLDLARCLGGVALLVSRTHEGGWWHWGRVALIFLPPLPISMSPKRFLYPLAIPKCRKMGLDFLFFFSVFRKVEMWISWEMTQKQKSKIKVKREAGMWLTPEWESQLLDNHTLSHKSYFEVWKATPMGEQVVSPGNWGFSRESFPHM